MASSDNLASLEPCFFRPSFPESWISEAYARDTEALTKALQQSLCYNTNSNSISISETLTSDSISPFRSLLNIETAPPTPTASNLSGSDPETAGAAAAASKRQRNAVPGASGKVSKRKSRASKRSQTTFITADPANFRQMVQQVTGVRFGNSPVPMVPVLKPEPQRPGNRLQGSAGCLPTLDTSAFLLDHHQQQVVVSSTSGSGSGAGPVVGSGPLSFPQPAVGDGGAGTGAGIDFDTFSSFPTLESWKVM